jgi:hypothetical protein
LAEEVTFKIFVMMKNYVITREWNTSPEEIYLPLFKNVIAGHGELLHP